MNILIDTNIFIPLESQSVLDIEPETHKINEFYKKAKSIDYHIFLLDLQKKDIQNDKNKERKEMRLLAFEKYELLENVKPTQIILTNFPNVPNDSHDYIDVALLNALCTDAVSMLVTDDEGIHKKAKKIGKSDSVYYLSDALYFINNQLPAKLQIIHEHPIVKSEKCFNIDEKDSFFDSLRNSYKNFDKWFIEKCKGEHRDCFELTENGRLVGICIYKFEPACYGMTGRILKICTFKLEKSGNKLGELLLRKLFDSCYDSNVDWIYVTAFEDNYICQFFENFGFEPYKERKEDTNELILRKKMIPEKTEKLSSIDYDIKYGPRYFDVTEHAFIVPIQKEFHDLLFPETLPQGSLFPEEIEYKNSYSNAIRKAYICKSNTTKLHEGSILFFDRTHSVGTIKVCGVVESIKRTSNPNELIILAGKRTVYKKEEIEKMCEGGQRQNLLILFRQTLNLHKEIKINELIAHNLINGIPQTITEISEEAKKWILQEM